MKNLLYKDLTLVFTPTLFLLMGLFILLPLIPSYPDGATFIYLITFYPLIFLGANKGTQSNDVYFSLTLPVSRKKIIYSRLLTMSLIHFAMLLASAIFIALGTHIEETYIVVEAAEEVHVGLGFDGILAMYGFGLISLGVLDLIFIPMFYKTGKNFGIPFTVASIVYGIIISTFLIILPSAVPSFYNIFGNWNAGIQLGTFFGGLAIYIGLRFITGMLGTKAFEKVDF